MDGSESQPGGFVHPKRTEHGVEQAIVHQQRTPDDRDHHRRQDDRREEDAAQGAVKPVLAAQQQGDRQAQHVGADNHDDADDHRIQQHLEKRTADEQREMIVEAGEGGVWPRRPFVGQPDEQCPQDRHEHDGGENQEPRKHKSREVADLMPAPQRPGAQARSRIGSHGPVGLCLRKTGGAGSSPELRPPRHLLPGGVIWSVRQTSRQDS